MKKVISILLVLVMCCSLCACSNSDNNKSKYVGIWESSTNSSYMYIYADGTGDMYQPGGEHFSFFTWDVEGDYLVAESDFLGVRITKYTLVGDNLCDKQGKAVFTKYSSDPSVDLTAE